VGYAFAHEDPCFDVMEGRAGGAWNNSEGSKYHLTGTIIEHWLLLCQCNISKKWLAQDELLDIYCLKDCECSI
jgi:hypothetical protein